MQALNLPTYQFKIKSNENKQLIFDKVRKKYVVLTPEEWVRQNYIEYLITVKKYPLSLIAVEKQLLINNRKKRFDILIHDTNGKPHIIVECKSSKVKITQNTFDQMARYNMNLQVDFLIATNGLEHYYCKMDTKNKKYIFLEDVEPYQNK